jgi:hypothetical protein
VHGAPGEAIDEGVELGTVMLRAAPVDGRHGAYEGES